MVDGSTIVDRSEILASSFVPPCSAGGREVFAVDILGDRRRQGSMEFERAAVLRDRRHEFPGSGSTGRESIAETARPNFRVAEGGRVRGAVDGCLSPLYLLI